MKRILGRCARLAGFSIIRTPKKKFNPGILTPSDVAYLHIGKTAGGTIKSLSEALRSHGVNIIRLDHSVRKVDVPSNVPYFFSIRDPIARFRSGWHYINKQLNKRLAALPEYEKRLPILRHERLAHEYFEDPNTLAEALFRDDRVGRLAIMAIQSDRHSAGHQIDYFSRTCFFEINPPIWIIRQEQFDSDFNTLLERMGLSVTLDTLNRELIDNQVKKNVSDYRGVPELSDLAVENLRRWYARDIQFYGLCCDWMAEQE